MTHSVYNNQYADAINEDSALRIISRTSELVLVVDLSYDWQRYESGREETDLKTILLYGPHSKPIKPVISAKGHIIDPGGRFNIIPLGDGLRLRTVSTPRFDGHGRPLGSDPTSWMIPATIPNRILDSVIDSTKDELQAIIDAAVLADL